MTRPASTSTLLATTDAIGLLRAGATPAQTWRDAFDAATEADGAPVLPADRASTRALRAAGRLAHRSGAPLADVLVTIADCERARERSVVARELALAGPEASGAVLRWLPVAGWALAMAVDSRALTLLATTPIGWILLAAGGGLWLAGQRWIRALTERAAVAGADAEAVALPLALAEAAVVAGLDVRAAIEAAGYALADEDGASLVAVADDLAAGSSWEVAWGRHRGADDPLARALRSSWTAGASPLPTLRSVRESAVESGRTDAERAAARLGVRVALPLALCLLPSFVVLGVVPLLLAVARGMGLETVSP